MIPSGHTHIAANQTHTLDAAYDVLLDTCINISPLPVWMEEWEHPEAYVNPALLANIAREGIRL